jgi:mono/diheme cytochrome c family protein
MKAKWLLIVLGPAVALVIGSVLALLFVPHPVPRNAMPGQRLYLTYCAVCHAADGRGSWRATLFLLRPPNLADPRVVDTLSDDYLFMLLKDGGATIGKPGMPAFGYSLSDDQLRELVRFVRTLPNRPTQKAQ